VYVMELIVCVMELAVYVMELTVCDGAGCACIEFQHLTACVLDLILPPSADSQFSFTVFAVWSLADTNGLVETSVAAAPRSRSCGMSVTLGGDGVWSGCRAGSAHKSVGVGSAHMSEASSTVVIVSAAFFAPDGAPARPI
jgi:hypothetical protein